MATVLHRLVVSWIPNVLLVVGIVLLIDFNLAPLAFALLVVSRWQLLLGGPKTWLRNIRASGCEAVVGLSAVSSLILFRDDTWLQIGIALAYAFWLLVIKPLGGPVWVALQAGLGQLAGLSVIFLLGRAMPEVAVLALSWLVAAVSADHFLTVHHEPARRLIINMWALIVAELSWLLWRWLIVYSLFNGRLLVPQAPLIITVLGYMLGGMYLYHAEKKLDRRRLMEYLLVGCAVLMAIIIGTKWDSRL